MRRTKIIATLGPATEDPDIIREMIRTGVNVFRLNMSHAQHDWVRNTIWFIREQASRMERQVAVLMDTQGPAIRTGDLPNNLELKAGDTFTFMVRGEVSEEVFSVDTNYDDLIRDIAVGDVVMVDNGVIQMLVQEKKAKELVCKVLTPGSLGSRRHINLPGVKVNLPCLTSKDIDDIKVGIECEVDYVALSFVREAGDILKLREVLDEKGGQDISIVAKIEDQSAVHNIQEIVNVADAVMVARGDLGIEWPYEELPIVQRRIIKTCVRSLKPVIVATHMLESMIQSPMPTRAEITDVANAVFEQADAIMLSGETTVGKYPLKCVEVLDRVARRIERSGNIRFHEKIRLETGRDNVMASAVDLANEIHADALVVFTRAGVLAKVAAGLRPNQSPVLVFTQSSIMARRLNLLYGVYPQLMEFNKDDPMGTISAAEAYIRKRSLLADGAKLVIVSEMNENGRKFWTIQLRTLGDN